MEAILELLTRREHVIALAIIGAVLATIGSYARARTKPPVRWSNVLIYLGYGFTGVSVILFITAGFRA